MIRSPLDPISSNRVHKHEYTPYQRGLIHEAISGGLTPSKVQRLYGISESSVRDICNAAVWQHHGQSKSRSGRPKKLSLRDERHIIRVVRLDPKITYRNLLTKTGIDVSAKTVYRLLKEKGITNWICKKRSLLTPEMAGKRYAWALAHADWGFDEWAKISGQRLYGATNAPSKEARADDANGAFVHLLKKKHDSTIQKRTRL